MSGHTRTRSPTCNGSGGEATGAPAGGAADALLVLPLLLLLLLLLVLLPALLLLLLLLLASGSSAGAGDLSAQTNSVEVDPAADSSGDDACRRVRRCDSSSSFECERELLEVVVVEEEGTPSALMLPSEEPSSFPFAFPVPLK